jgi:circadian clock protein KaiB
MNRAEPEPSGRAPPQYVLRLYVAGGGNRSLQAIANIRAICEQRLAGRFTLEVVDLYLEPERARQAQIVAIPTLVKESPLPVRHIIGDLGDTAAVCANLDLGG